MKLMVQSSSEDLVLLTAERYARNALLDNYALDGNILPSYKNRPLAIGFFFSSLWK